MVLILEQFAQYFYSKVLTTFAVVAHAHPARKAVPSQTSKYVETTETRINGKTRRSVCHMMHKCGTYGMSYRYIVEY